LRRHAFRDLDLRHKIMVVGALPTVLLLAAILVVLAVQKSRAEREIERGVGSLAEENLARASRDLRTLCEATHDEISRQVPRSLRIAHEEMDRTGPLSFSREQVTWRARNQLDGSVREMALPRLLLGGRWTGQNADFSAPTVLVDRVRDLTGADATLFQRMNERGDMLRVATTVPDGQRRAIGTYIPAFDPGGAPNPVVSTVLRGETYRGRARVVDQWYIAGYEPLRDAAGRVVGMLFIGLRHDSLEGLRAGVAASRIGESGTLYVLGAGGNQRGRYLIPPPGHPDGEDVWEAKDARGRAYVQDLVSAALAAQPGQTVQVAHAVAGEGGERHRLAAVSYFAPWDWVIVAEMDREEAVAALRAIESSLTAAAVTLGAVALLLLAFTIWSARTAARRIAAPLEGMASAAERIAQGDVEQAVAYRSRDEVGRLAEAFRGTIGYIQDVARGAAALAEGDLSKRLALRSDRDELGRSFQAAQAAVQALLADVKTLQDGAVEGRLGVRADAARHRGEFRAIVEGMNATLATFVSHLDAMPVPAMIVDAQFNILYMNETGASLLGRAPADLVGTKCYDGFHMGDCRTRCCAAARAMQEDREVSSETDAHPEGLDLEVVYSAVPVRDRGGRVIGALEVVSDQTAVQQGASGVVRLRR
jgi:PAS domain S-box-containing protein